MLYVIGYLVLVGLVLRFFHVTSRGDCDRPRVRRERAYKSTLTARRYTDNTQYFGEDV